MYIISWFKISTITVTLCCTAVMSLVPQVEGSTGTVHHPIPRSTRNRRAQTLSIQRQQNSSPPPNATVDTKETLDIPDHSMLPGLSRNQPCRKSELSWIPYSQLDQVFVIRYKEKASELVKKAVEEKCWEWCVSLVITTQTTHNVVCLIAYTNSCPQTLKHMHVPTTPWGCVCSISPSADNQFV